jgi:hypothetical protein
MATNPISGQFQEEVARLIELAASRQRAQAMSGQVSLPQLIENRAAGAAGQQSGAQNRGY